MASGCHKFFYSSRAIWERNLSNFATASDPVFLLWTRFIIKSKMLTKAPPLLSVFSDRPICIEEPAGSGMRIRFKAEIMEGLSVCAHRGIVGNYKMRVQRFHGWN